MPPGPASPSAAGATSGGGGSGLTLGVAASAAGGNGGVSNNGSNPGAPTSPSRRTLDQVKSKIQRQSKFTSGFHFFPLSRTGGVQPPTEGQARPLQQVPLALPGLLPQAPAGRGVGAAAAGQAAARRGGGGGALQAAAGVLRDGDGGRGRGVPQGEPHQGRAGPAQPGEPHQRQRRQKVRRRRLRGRRGTLHVRPDDEGRVRAAVLLDNTRRGAGGSGVAEVGREVPSADGHRRCEEELTAAIVDGP